MRYTRTPHFILPVLLTLISSMWVSAQLSITLNDIENSSVILESYGDSTPFALPFANLHSKMDGFIHQPKPSNACSYIDPLPFSNNSWFALVDDYPSCTSEMVMYVRNAGYELIITSSTNDSYRKISKDVGNMGFPIVVVKQEYANYLIENALSNFTNPRISASVEASILITVVIVLSATLYCCCCCCCCCYLCIRVCRHRRGSTDLEHQINEIEERRRNFDRIQHRERFARQELIESILRQLQELQVDLQSQVPLGETETKKLPTRKFQHGKENTETCAVCVEDFVNGELLRVLPCNHAYHLKCIDEWLIHHSALCPLCKKQVPRGDQAENTQGRLGANVGRRDESSNSDNGPYLVRFSTDDDDESDTRSDDLLIPVGTTSNTSQYGSV